MKRITLKLPEVKMEPETRPQKCPYCGSSILSAWGKAFKRVRDPFLGKVVVHRYLCTRCRRSFRHYPEGVSRADQTQRMIVLAALMWGLGLSLRNVAYILRLLQIPLSMVTVWRDVQAVGEEIRQQPRWRGKVLAVDGAGVRVRGCSRGVVIAICGLGGIPVDIAFLPESEEEELRSWLKPMLEEMGAEVVVSDEAGGYGWISGQEGIRHQRCRVHLRRRVRRRLKKIEKEAEEKYGKEDERTKQIKEDGKKLKAIVQALPEGGEKILWPLWKRYRWVKAPKEGAEAEPGYRMRKLINGIMEHYREYRVFKEVLLKGLDGTTNRVEGAIGMYRVREKMARGFKSEEGLKNGWMVMAAAYWTRRVLAA